MPKNKNQMLVEREKGSMYCHQTAQRLFGSRSDYPFDNSVRRNMSPTQTIEFLSEKNPFYELRKRFFNIFRNSTIQEILGGIKEGRGQNLVLKIQELARSRKDSYLHLTEIFPYDITEAILKYKK